MNVVHIEPVNDLIDHDTSDQGTGINDTCLCGPTVEFVTGGAVVSHHSLDGREAKEVTR